MTVALRRAVIAGVVALVLLAASGEAAPSAYGYVAKDSWLTWDASTSTEPCAAGILQGFSPLIERLARWPGGLVWGPDGEMVSVAGMTPSEAREALLPVTRQQGLPRDYWPRDLVWVSDGRGGVLVRAVVAADLRAMLEAARESGVPIALVSGFRSWDKQAFLFRRRTAEELAKAHWTISVEEARQRAGEDTAAPGHSQHQLGVAIDISIPELNYDVVPEFEDTQTGRWLRGYAWRYGFVFPYTRQSEARTGYVYEPWHLRWVGRTLAAFLMYEGYLDSPNTVVDDYLEAIQREVFDAPPVAAVTGGCPSVAKGQ